MSGLRWSEEDLANHLRKLADVGRAAGVSPGIARGGTVEPRATSGASLLDKLALKKMRDGIFDDEDEFQKAAAAMLDAELPAHCRFFHVPNGGHRHPAVAGKLKTMGVKRGVGDVIILDRGRYVWIELKIPGGVLSEFQIEWRDWILANGGQWFVAFSLAEVRRACAIVGITLRGGK